MLLSSTFQTTAIYDEVLRQVCATLGIETFKKNSRKPWICFSKVTVSPFRYQLALENRLYIMQRQLSIASLLRRNRSLYLLCRPLKLSWKTRRTILMYLGQDDCPPSTLGLFCERCCEAIKTVSGCRTFSHLN